MPCFLEALCQEIAPPEFGNVSFQFGDNGEKNAVFSCAVGYVLVGVSTNDCFADDWNGQVPICKLGMHFRIQPLKTTKISLTCVDIFGDVGTGPACHFNSSANCTYVNDAKNPIMWHITENWSEGNDGTTKLTIPPATLLRCEPQFCPHRSSEVSHQRIALPSRDNHVSRPELAEPTSTEVILNIPKSRRRLDRSDPIVSAMRSCFEIGKFTKAMNKNYLKFSVIGAEGVIAQELTVFAHCLPDPPGHLDHLSSDGYSMVRMTLSKRMQTKCIQLKDRVQYCNEFTIRFSVFVKYYKTETHRIRFIPKGTYETMAGAACYGENTVQ